MKAICFRCHFVGDSSGEPRCPQCGYPLIQTGEMVAQGGAELERLFTAKPNPPPLPGVDPEPRKAQLLVAQRKERAARAAAEQAQRRARRHARLRLVGELFAASALVAGLLVTLEALGAL